MSTINNHLQHGATGWADLGMAADGQSGLGPTIERAHREKMLLCATLEEVADGLPSRVNPLQCLAVASALVPMLRAIHRYEENVVFPVYLTIAGGGGDAIASIARLKAEHVEDECFADELTEVLMALGHGGRVDNPEATGFMLRGFFETIRRHVAFEREHILPTIATSDEP